MFCLGVAISFRSIFVVMAPLFLFWLLYDIGGLRAGVRRLITGLAALFIPSIPALMLFVSSPSRFWFNNLGFHLQRETASSAGELAMDKIIVLAKFIILPQTVLLVGLALATLVLRRFLVDRGSRLTFYALAIAVLITAVYLLPHPVLLQYFQQTIPYLVLAGLPALALIASLERLRWLRLSGGVLYLLGILPFLILFVLSPRENDKRTTWDHVKQVISEIQANSSSSDTVLSEWAGFAVLSERPQLAGSEHVGWEYPLPVSDSVYHENHLLTNEDFVSVLRRKRPRLVISDYRLSPQWAEAIKENYRLVSQTGITSIYQRIDEAG
jgi:hypothetical protein